MFNRQYFIAGYFPPVWFAEADDSHLLPEERHDYYGNGKAARGQSDDDLIRQVIDKWEAIEQAQAKSRDSVPGSGAAPANDDRGAMVATVAVLQPAMGDATFGPSSAAIDKSIADAALAAIAAANAKAKAQRNEEALALILACL